MAATSEEQSENRTRILEIIAEEPDLTPEQIAERVGVHHSTVRRHLKQGEMELKRLRETQAHQREMARDERIDPQPPERKPEPQAQAKKSAPEGRREFRTHLKPRHAEYLMRYAAMYGVSTEQALERMVRAAYAADPTKAGLITPDPQRGATSYREADKGKYQ